MLGGDELNANVRIVVANALYVIGLSKDLRCQVVQDLSRPNPEYVKRERMGLRTNDITAKLCLAKSAKTVDDVVFQLPRGYLETLLQRIKAAGDAPIVEDRRLEMPPIDVEFHGELFPYQKKALETMTKYDSGVLVSPCGSGKTALGMALIAHWKQPALILIHTKDLLQQTCGAVRQWLGIEPGIVGDVKFDVQPVTVATVQTLSRRPDLLDDIKGLFGLVLQDECAHAPATSWTAILQAFPAICRFGVTATPSRQDGLWPFAEAVLGPVRCAVTASELRQAGRSVVPEIRWVQTDFDSFSSDWVDLVSDLVQNERRNRLILSIILRALDDGRKIIALSERISHVEALAERLNHLRPGAAVLATGKARKKDREAAMRKMAEGEARVLFATKLADEGLDLASLDCLVLMTPSRDGARTTQRAGRVLRSLPDKRSPVIFDIVVPRVRMLASQARSRFFDCYRTIAPGQRLPEWLETHRRVTA